MKRLQAILISVALLLFSVALAQSQNTVTGLVTDTQGEPLPGVTIAIVGTTTGGYSGINGEFSITVPDAAQGAAVTFNASFIGFVTQVVETTVGSHITIVLEEDLQNLEELVVVGYDVQKKTHLTGSISKMETHGIENVPTSRADQVLQGRIAGVQVQNTTSEVGVEAEINIRGVGSISANSSPLVIVDGFPIEDGLGMVDAEDIASIEVLKDAASAAIYGSRAANGVILVTTKSGSLNKPKYTLKTSFGVKDYHDLHPIMSNQEYTSLKAYEDQLKGLGELSSQAFAMSTINNSTNWQEEALQNAFISKTSFSVSGGKEEVKYYISTSYLTDEGIMRNNKYDKFSLRSKLDVKLSDKLKIGANMTATYADRERPTNNFIDFYRTPSFMPVRHTEQTAAITGEEVGSYAHGGHFTSKEYTGTDPISGLERTVNEKPFGTSNTNPASRMDNETQGRQEYRIQSSAFLQVAILDNFWFKTSNGFNVNYREEMDYRNLGSAKSGATNTGEYSNRLYTDLLTENTFTYNQRFRKHDVNALLGFSAQKINEKSAGIYGIDFPTDYIQKLNAAGTILQYDGTDHVTGTWEEASSMVSFFSRFMYAYDDKYLISTSIRTDGSSKFGKDNRWGWFPSVALGWRVAEEDFVQDVAPWLNELKLRTSYGITGTDNIENYANVNMLNSANYSFGSSTVTPGITNSSTTLGNSALQWEQTNEYNTGFDLYVLNSRIGLILDAYYSITRSLLYERSINSASGYTQAWSNEGKVRNRGIEFTLTTYNIKNKDFTWSTALNFSRNKNIVLDLGGPQQIISTGERGDNGEMYIARVGEPLVQFYGFRTIGVWNSVEEIAANPSHNDAAPGGLRLENTNDDKVINDEDLQITGSPYPNFTYGMTNTFTYKGLDLSFLLQGSQGGKVWNGDVYYKETGKFNKAYAENRWVNAENPGDGKTPYEQNGIHPMATDFGLQDASYLALKDLSVGYKFDSDALKKIGIGSLRLYASFQNLWYLTSSDYKGINIEARSTSGNYASPLVSGYQRGAFPTQRTYNFGLELTF